MELYTLQFLQKFKFMTLSFIFLILCLTQSAIGTPVLESLCNEQTNNRFIDFSSAKIQKITTFEYSLSLFDTPINIIRNGSQTIFEGNFSKITLKNYALKKQFIYYGTRLIFKMPADHVFTNKQIPDLQIQIMHTAQNSNKENPYHFVMLSQLYIVSKFQNKIRTVLSKYFNLESTNGMIVETSKVVEVIQGFSLLMYKGSADTFPCRSDLLCFIKREHQLIGQQDLDALKNLISNAETTQTERTYFLRKNIYQINSIKKEESKTGIENDEL